MEPATGDLLIKNIKNIKNTLTSPLRKKYNKKSI